MDKICTECKIEKNISFFSKKNKLKDGTQRHSPICKECFNIKDAERRKTKEYKDKKIKYDKLYYDDNQEKILERKKEYHIENRKDILYKKQIYRDKPETKVKIKEYKLNNKDRLKNIQKEYRKRHPHIIAWRNMLHRTLNHIGKEKEGSTKEELGYSAVQLKHHIEKQFKEGMSWDNHGEWEIDHILPLTLFDSTSTPKEVNALSNLQPLWKEENRHKYNNII